MNKDEIKKPSLDLEVKAEIKGLSKIEDNITEVKNKAVELKEYYAEVTFTDDVMSEAVEEKKKVNDFKGTVARFRIDTIEKFKEPIILFEKTAKETEKILTETYDFINSQVEKYRDAKKEKIRQEAQRYFKEYATSKSIDFIQYLQMNQNVTLSSSDKSLKAEINAFIDKIVDDLNLIETQNYQEEMLVEYKQSLNVSQAINVVINRKKALEEELRRQEELKAKKETEKQAVEKIDKVLETPVTIGIDTGQAESKQVEIFKVAFIVKGTKEQMTKLKEFLINGGYEYE